MGLVQAFINQIGREAARDVYRSGKKKLASVVDTSQPTFTNQGILNEIQNFELTSSKTTTLLKLTNLIERAENTEVNNFDWEEIFIELDNKIEFCREDFGTTSNEMIEDLDRKNEKNFRIKKDEHLSFINELIRKQVQQHEGGKNIPFILGIISSFLGIAPIVLGQQVAKSVLFLITMAFIVLSIYYGLQLFNHPESYIQDAKVGKAQALRLANFTAYLLFLLGGIFYSLIVLSSLKQFSKKREIQNRNNALIVTLENYLKAYK